jgi:hypothetical protein
MVSQAQYERMLVEKKLLEHEFPQGRLISSNGTLHFEVGIRTSSGQEFTLDVVVGRRFPDKMPLLFVVSPRVLPKRGGRGTVNEERNSHAFHTLENGPGGLIQLCHFKETWWDSSKTICATVTKGIIWCESYMAYMCTGKPISSYCA